MPYTVTLSPRALDEFAKLWLQSTNRSSLTHASNGIDEILRRNPHLGENLEFYRVIRIPPLEAYYTISELDCRVNIFSYELMDPGT